MDNALIVLSGGQDSSTTLFWAKSKFSVIKTITFDYEQKHKIELESASKIANIANVENLVVKLPMFKTLNDSALVDNMQDINSLHNSQKQLPASFVPNRNSIFFATAHAYAQKLGFTNIVVGISQADYSGYPDCREDFLISLEKTLNLGSQSEIKFLAPLLFLTKKETFQLAKDLDVLEIIVKHTHTCYNAERSFLHDWGYGCEECPACMLRKKGWIEFCESLM